MPCVVLNNPKQAAQWLQARVSGALYTDSRKAGVGDGFIAWPGSATDGRQYVSTAISQGISAALAEQVGASSYEFDSESIALYPQLKTATGWIAAEYYGHPSRNLDVVAITGTNGKTSTAWWLAQALNNVSRRCAVVGTLGVGEPPNLIATGLTTPDPVLLQQQLRKFVDQGVVACAMEASSIGIVERRLDGTAIKVAVFTNFTQDHLDYHGDMPSYWQAKAQLFDWPQLQAAVINMDDAHGEQLYRHLQKRNLALWTVALEKPARLQAVNICYYPQGQSFDVLEGDTRVNLSTQALGNYNISNLLGVIATLRALGIDLPEAARACEHLHNVPGRMECVGGQDAPLLVVDYAHSPDALEKALKALQPIAQSRGGALHCVFGCGGDRDPSKRTPMARVAERFAQHVVVTSDNPRSESPKTIIEQVLKGFTKPQQVVVQADRAIAIAQAVQNAGVQDVVLIAGKGHETYQEIEAVRYAFSDMEHATRALQLRQRIAA
jgi:UDP-N-acetylmuramyl-tripeptide synthetase